MDMLDGGSSDEFDGTCSSLEYTGMSNTIGRVVAVGPLLPIRENSQEASLPRHLSALFWFSVSTNPSSLSLISALLTNCQGPLLFQLLHYYCFVMFFYLHAMLMLQAYKLVQCQELYMITQCNMKDCV
ncbi:unnamed protein product [Urochloa humidicola]